MSKRDPSKIDPYLLSANINMTEVMTLMQTTLNKDKSGYILMGSKQQVEEARKRMQDNPIVCGNFLAKELKEEKWLGTA